MAEDELELGFVSGFFGVRGEVRLHMHHRDSDYLRKERSVVLVAPDGRRMSARLRSRTGAGKRIIGVIRGVASREACEVFKDWRICIPRRNLPGLADPDAFYVADLLGMPVRRDGDEIGRVAFVHATGPVEVLEIDVGAKEPEFVPALAEVIALHLDEGYVELRVPMDELT